ncbi:TPM domain-containing protein [Entomomonas sp. E2T0]|uniref:TPM domain-containing protein n=1 Tax=Entomomonas sp. E2T0 TaxID=2930213 RepID=UPI0022283A8B|nr:TPM domain-containing protein [Entomomonas sp. E2T0]UYZ85034.1 TPM domain-containing protein [Entomomonas sp. E2T0]
MNYLLRPLFIIIFSSLFCHITVYAETVYPSPNNDYVNDFANIVHPTDKSNLLRQLETVEEQTGIEIVVVTINAMADYGYTGTTIEPFATDFFNTWGVGHKETNDGIMILVSKQDRKVRIELGLGYSSKYNGLMKDVIDEKMLPFFKTGDYSRGIYEGTQAVINNVTKQVSWFYFYRWELGLTALAILCIGAAISCMRSGKKGWGWIFFTIAGFLILIVIKLLLSGNKKRGGFGGGRSGGGGASGSW